MKPERIKAIREWLLPVFDDLATIDVHGENRRRGEWLGECLDEIERLQSELAKHQKSERNPDCSLLKELASRVRDWYGLRGVPMDDASVLRMCVQDVEASQAVYLRLEAPVVDLIRAVESVQDWSETQVGDKIEAVEEILNHRY